MHLNYSEISFSQDFTFIKTAGCRSLLFMSALVMWIELTYPTDTTRNYSEKHHVHRYGEDSITVFLLWHYRSYLTLHSFLSHTKPKSLCVCAQFWTNVIYTCLTEFDMLANLLNNPVLLHGLPNSIEKSQLLILPIITNLEMVLNLSTNSVTRLPLI